MRASLRERLKKADKDSIPTLEELFVISVTHALEAGHMLGLSLEDFLSSVETAWNIDNDRRNDKGLDKK